MKTKYRMKKVGWFTQGMASFCCALLITVGTSSLVPQRASAIDIQALPDTVAAVSGFTHAARVTFADLATNDASAVVFRLFNVPTNAYIDRVAFYVEEQFTNAAYGTGVANGSNLVFTVGVGGTTNFFFGSNVLDTTHLVGFTNSLVPHKSATSTNYLIACFSDGIQASAVDNYLVGKIRIYWRVVSPIRWRF